MNQSQINHDNSIAEDAELEIWQNVRDDTRRRLVRVVTVGVFYLLAALAVGAYLILAIAHVGGDSVMLRHWRPQPVDVSWMTQFAFGYAAMAVMVIIVYTTMLMLIQGKIPAALCPVVGAVPWIGSTMRIVAMGEFCQSIYQSLLRSQTYGIALEQASKTVRHASLSRWSAQSSTRIDSGQSLLSVLPTSPIQDQPLFAVAAFANEQLPTQDSVRLWRRATAECHLLAQSRLDRTALVISITCLLASVFIAFFALLLSGMSMKALLQGLMY